MALRLGVDAWNLPGDRRGIGRYVRALVSCWTKDSQSRVHLTLVVPEKVAILARGRYLRELDGRRLPVITRRQVSAKHLDVLWYPWNGLSWGAPVPKVATLHDASIFAFPAVDAATREREQRPFKAAAAEAQQIITDSGFSKNELVRHLGLAETRIHVVPLGVELPAGPLPRAAHFAGVERFVLFVGEAEPRKGLDTLGEALENLPPKLQRGLALVVAGRVPPRRTPPGGIKVRRIDLGHVSDRALASLYIGATALVYPSRYEGFGLPVLEAMAWGTPVIASDAAGIAEAAGAAALVFEAGNPAALAGALERLLADPALAERLRKSGLTRAADMPWRNTAEKTLQILRDAAQ